MITAKEARELTLKKDVIYKRELSTEKILEDCYDSIRRFCESESKLLRANPSRVVSMCTSIQYSVYISDEVKNKLTDLGYKVYVMHGYRIDDKGYTFDRIDISWEEDGER